MKSKKALKRLEKVEALLSDVIDRFPAQQRELGDLLNSAKATVIRAKKRMESQALASSDGRVPAHAELTATKNIQPDARNSGKRRLPAKRKNVSSHSGARLTRTA
jgi:hypothetical protein